MGIDARYDRDGAAHGLRDVASATSRALGALAREAEGSDDQLSGLLDILAGAVDMAVWRFDEAAGRDAA